jgi:hypothetical protein
VFREEQLQRQQMDVTFKNTPAGTTFSKKAREPFNLGVQYAGAL